MGQADGAVATSTIRDATAALNTQKSSLALSTRRGLRQLAEDVGITTPLRALGVLALGFQAADLGWNIGGAIDRHFLGLHLPGDKTADTDHLSVQVVDNGDVMSTASCLAQPGPTIIDGGFCEFIAPDDGLEVVDATTHSGTVYWAKDSSGCIPPAAPNLPQDGSAIGELIRSTPHPAYERTPCSGNKTAEMELGFIHAVPSFVDPSGGASTPTLDSQVQSPTPDQVRGGVTNILNDPSPDEDNATDWVAANMPDPPPGPGDPLLPAVPNCFNATADGCASMLTDVGYVPELHTLPEDAPSATVGPDRVARTNPGAGVHASPGSTVKVYVNPSSAPEPTDAVSDPGFNPLGDPVVDGRDGTEPAAPTGGWGPTLPGFDLSPLKVGQACNVFPFGIPCWLVSFVGSFDASPKAPKIDWGLSWPFDGQKISVDLSIVDPIMPMLRVLLGVFSVVGIVLWLGRLSTKRGGGEDD